MVLFVLSVCSPAEGQTNEITSGEVTVVPFINLRGVPAEDWFGEGIAEAVAAGLNDSEVGRHLVVRVADGEARVSRGGAPWTVSGAYQRLGDGLRITARVTEGRATTIGALTVDGVLEEFFTLQDRLVAELVPILARVLGYEGATLSRTPRPATVPMRPSSPMEPQRVSREMVPVVPRGIDGPAAPVAPAVINRDAEGGVTVHATRLTEDINIDGVLDEGIYEVVPAITGFIQQFPDEGAPASQKTEAWVAFNDQNLYVAARLWSGLPRDQWVANEMRRDSFQILQNDNFSVTLDTFYDRRNAAGFVINPLGGFFDFAITNEGNPNVDWNPVWDVRTGRFEGGWTVEIEIPFRSLRFRPGPDQIWGIQFRRGVGATGERAFLTPLPISLGRASLFRVSESGTLVGLEVPDGSRNIEIKPYAIGGVSTNRVSNPPTNNVGNGDVGIDVKYGITQNLTADFTYNTDFAQVEVDEQQVNLTRFSLFFPEKREFFLEGRGIFDFARGASVSGFGSALRRVGGGGPGGGGNAPTLFYSRQIGLTGGSVVPILGGGRVTGKIGAFDVGVININTDDKAVGADEMTNFTVGRVKRDVLRRSSLGALFTNRSVSLDGDGASQTYGADGTFSFYDNIGIVTYLAKTDGPERSDENLSYQGRFNYGGDRYGLQAEHLLVEKNFTPEMGFLRRDNFRRTYSTGRFSPRPASIASVRQFRFEGSLDYIERADSGIVETRQAQLGFGAEFTNTDQFTVNVAENYEFLVRPFRPGPTVTLPVGGYHFRDLEASYTTGPQRLVVGTFQVRVGEYFNGTIRSFGMRRGRVALTDQFSLEPSVSVNWIETPVGKFRTDLLVTRVNYTLTPRMFISGLTQYNSASDTISANLRLRWQYSPGSELFVVYTEDRETDPLMPDRYTELRNRGFVVKVNRLFRY